MENLRHDVLAKSVLIQENEREVGLWNDLPWFCNVFQVRRVDLFW